MEELKKVNVSILGKNYSLSTDENEADVKEAAQMVDSLFKNANRTKTSAEDFKVAIFVALQLALDLNKGNKKVNLWQDKIETLTHLLENGIA